VRAWRSTTPYELGDAGHVGIASKVLLDRLDSRILDVSRSRKVRLAAPKSARSTPSDFNFSAAAVIAMVAENFDAADTVRISSSQLLFSYL